MKTHTAAVTDLAKVLEKQATLKAAFDEENKKWEHTKKKIKTYLLEGEWAEHTHAPEIVHQQEPFLAWKIGEKTDKDLLETIYTIRNVLLPDLEAKISTKVEELKEQKEQLEKYALALLEQRGTSNFSVTGLGRVEKRTDVKYNVADKALFVEWAIKNHCESELTITLRPNSKFMGQVVEENGEMPAGVSSFREAKAVFVKA